MTKFTDTKMPKSVCCECGAKLDGAAGEGDITPDPGDMSVCIYCGSLNVFSDNLTLRKPTVEEYVESTKNRKLQEYRKAVIELGNYAKFPNAK